MLKSIFFSGFFLNLLVLSCAQQPDDQRATQLASVPPGFAAQPFNGKEQPSTMVDFDAFLALAAEVQVYRKNRLVNLDRFLQLAQQPNTIILDTRSQQFYAFKHIKGAQNLTFADFTIQSLARVIPSPETTILIYCNNNFADDPMFFMSKIAPLMEASGGMGGLQSKKPISLALNIPTFINLYGYGYKNVYELESMLSVSDSRLEFEGAAVQPVLKKG